MKTVAQGSGQNRSNSRRTTDFTNHNEFASKTKPTAKKPVVTLGDPPEDEETLPATMIISLYFSSLPPSLFHGRQSSCNTMGEEGRLQWQEGSTVARRYCNAAATVARVARVWSPPLPCLLMGCQPTHGPWATMDGSSPLEYGLAAHSSPKILNFDLNFISKLCCNRY